MSNNLLLNHGFEHILPNQLLIGTTVAKPPSNGAGLMLPASPPWEIWSNRNPADPIPEIQVTAALVPTSLLPHSPHSGPHNKHMMLICTHGERGGLVQTWTPAVPYVKASICVYVLFGQVGIGVGNGGNTGLGAAPGAKSTTTGQWEELTVEYQSDSAPANEFIVYAIGAAGACFCTDNASVVSVT